MKWKLENIKKLVGEPITGEWGEDGGGIKVLRTTNFTNDGCLDLSEVVERDIDIKKVQKKRLQFGDTIIEKSGGSPSQPVGRVVYFNIDSDEPYLCNNFTSVLRPNSFTDPKYFFWFLFYNHLTKNTLRFQNKTTGIINLQLPRYLTELQIPLPPLPTQQKIAAILDEADALRRKDKALLAKYDELLQAVFYDMFGDPVKNEKGWEVIELGELGKWQSGGTPSRSKGEYFEGDIPWLSSGELNLMYVNNSEECITEEAVNNSNAKIIPDGSLLLGMYDTAALKSCISKGIVTCNQAIAYCRLDGARCNTVFVYSIIQIGREHYRRLQRGVRQKNLNLSMVKEIEILLPPLQLQNKFVDIVVSIEQQKSQIIQQQTNSEALFQSLMQRAFKGELVG